MAETQTTEIPRLKARYREEIVPALRSEFDIANIMQVPGPTEILAENPPKIPKLLRAYLSFGARICGPPAIDREFAPVASDGLRRLAEALEAALVAVDPNAPTRERRSSRR